MYDGILVGLDMLLEAKETLAPEAVPLLFVLTDGQTQDGYELGRVDDVLAGLRIPIYTISYGGDVSELSRVASFNEAASLRADSSDIVFQIGSLLNAQM